MLTNRTEHLQEIRELITLLDGFEGTKPLFMAHFSLLCYAEKKIGDIIVRKEWIAFGQPENEVKEGKEIGSSLIHKWVDICGHRFMYTSPITEICATLRTFLS